MHVFTPRLTRRGITTEHVILPIAWQLCHEREGVCTNWTVSYPFPGPVLIQLTRQYAEERHKSSFHDFFLFLFVFLGICHQTILQRCQNIYFWNSQNFTPCTSFFYDSEDTLGGTCLKNKHRLKRLLLWLGLGIKGYGEKTFSRRKVILNTDYPGVPMGSAPQNIRSAD